MYFLVVLFGFAFSIGSVALKFEDFNGMPRNFVECFDNDALITETQNMTLFDVHVMCKELLAVHLKERVVKMKNPNVTNYVNHLLRGLISEITGDKSSRNKRSIFRAGRVLRREIREPPYDTTWGCYVRGVRRLKNDYSVSRTMNTYDIIASLHTGDAVLAGHDGPGFFGWHRAYIRIMEFAIGCPIPYWDVTIEYAMDDPTQSIVWSPWYFGNGYGILTTGPFANLPGDIPIIRNINAGGWLISNEDVNLELAKPNFIEFTEPSNCDGEDRSQYSFECIHNGAHVWVDGTFDVIETAPLDPMFFPMHAFIDKVFGLMKRQLGPNGVFPDKGIERHRPNDPLLFNNTFPGIERLTQSHGYSDTLDSLIHFSEKPNCPLCAGSRDLYCDRTRNICLPRRRQGVDAMARTRMQVRTATGMQTVDVYEPDVPSRADRLVERMGPLSIPGHKFRVTTRDSRTMGKSLLSRPDGQNVG